MSLVALNFFGKVVGVKNTCGSEVILSYPSKAVDFYQKQGWIIVDFTHSGVTLNSKTYAHLVKPKRL